LSPTIIKMNIEEIKRNLRASKAGGVNVNAPGAPPVGTRAPEREEEEREEHEHVTINKKLFEKPLEESEKPPPGSLVWNVEPPEGFDLLNVSVSKAIRTLELDNDAYQWDRSKPKGRKSRKEFTDFLVSSL
jgi:hypothetical protein